MFCNLTEINIRLHKRQPNIESWLENEAKYTELVQKNTLSKWCRKQKWRTSKFIPTPVDRKTPRGLLQMALMIIVVARPCRMQLVLEMAIPQYPYQSIQYPCRRNSRRKGAFAGPQLCHHRRPTRTLVSTNALFMLELLVLGVNGYSAGCSV
jgi:hypothetical protein